MDAVRRTVAAAGDATVSLLAAGDGETVVLLHGIPSGAQLWRDLLPRLARAGYRGLAPDLPGYGATRVPLSGDHSLGGAAELVARWLTGAGHAPAWVVGHDAGGAVAQILAVRHPAAVSRLTLTNSIVDGSWPAPRARFARAAARLRLYAPSARLGLVPNAYIRREIRRAFADPARYAAADADRVLWDTKVTTARGRAAFERHLAALTPADTASVVAELGRLAVPCQLVWGMDDAFQPWDVAGERLRALLPSPAVTKLVRCGHFTPLECPQRLLDAMLAWRGSPGAV